MQLENVRQHLIEILESHVATQAFDWLKEKIERIIIDKSTKDLYLTYSLIPTKIIGSDKSHISFAGDDLGNYLKVQKATVNQIGRIYLLNSVLESDDDFFAPKVANIIQVADTGELETFLKFLILLPNPENYKTAAVEALRTNIATVFNAIAYHNPYPAAYFNDQQWNQMYLKTAFMEGDLSAILEIDKRANGDLARIISDYAHERWAASRHIDPYFWRPVSSFLNSTLIEDMKRLLKSDNPFENMAGALSCHYSDNEEAKAIVAQYPDLSLKIENGEISWKTVKNKS